MAKQLKIELQELNHIVSIMGQQEYEVFKARLREWMDTHPDEYAAFEEATNARDYASIIF